MALTPTPTHSPTVIYPITQATVVGQDADKQTLYVILRDGQGVNPIPILFNGPCDALRIKSNPMPGKGTVGVVAFVNNDIKSGVWLGAYVPGLLDAISNSPDSPFTAYESHWSGYWSALDDTGNSTQVYPDGTSIVVGTEYTPHKHIRNSDGRRERVAVTPSDRPPVASSLPIKVTHSSGTTIEVDASGNVTLSSVGAVSSTSAGNTTITANGTANVTSPSQVNVSAPVVKVSNGGTTQFVVTETAWTYLTGHVHSRGQGGNNTGPPLNVPTIGVLSSVLTTE